MDPISAATTAIQVAAIGVESCVKLIKLLQDFIHASVGIKALVDRLTGLKILLKAFQEAWEHCQSASLEQDVKELFQRSESSLRRLDDACKTFHKETEQGKLQQTIQKYSQSAKYILKKNVIDGLIRDAGDFSMDVGKIMQICFFHKLHGDMINTLDDIRRKVSAVQTFREQDILRWVLRHAASDSSDYETTHREIRKRRAASTCKWLFATPEWEKLLRTDNSILWVFGIAGCGKSVLCSSVIDEVSRISEQSSDTTYAYYYFSRTGVVQSLERCLMSLIHQLCAQRHVIPDALHDAYANGTPPELEELKKILNELMQLSQRTILIFDALDECTEGDGRDAVMDWLQHVRCAQATTIVNLILTSRDQQDISDVLSEMQSISVNLDQSRNDEDIRNFVNQALTGHRRLNKVVKADPALAKNIIDSLVGDANGMFLLASSRVNMLRNLKIISPHIIEKALKELPMDVDAVYDRILSSIPKETQDGAIRALCWLAMARRPLTVEELAEVSVADPEIEHGPFVDTHRRLTIPEDILTLISDFITVRGMGSDDCIVQLAHATVYEYLLSDKIRNSETHRRIRQFATHTYLTRCCLRYIAWRHDLGPGSPDREETALPLIEYACGYWYEHFKLIPWKIQTAKEYQGVESQVLHFLESEGIFSTWRALHIHDEESFIVMEEETQACDVTIRTGSPLYYAAFLGLPMSCIQMLSTKFAVDLPSGYWGTPMHAAVASGSSEIALGLLHLGADPQTPNRVYENILIAAISNLMPDMALHLIHHNRVDLQACGGKALHEAIASHLNDVARALVAAGSSIHTVSQPRNADRKKTPLITAATSGNCEMIEFLYHQGADLNQQVYEDPRDWTPNGYMTALQGACESGLFAKAVQVLLRLGADVNVAKGYPCSPICCVARDGNAQTLRMVLQAGSDIQTYYSEPGNPLWAALHSAHRDVALILLEAKALLPGLDIEEMSRAIADAGSPAAWVDAQISRMKREEFMAAKDQMLHATIPAYTPKRPPRSDTLLTLPNITIEETWPMWI